MNLSAIAARPLGACAILAIAGTADAGTTQTIYQNAFDAPADIGAEWNRNDHTDGPLGGFLGRFTDFAAILNLSIPTGPGPDPDPDPIEPPVVEIDDLPMIGPIGGARSSDPLWVYSMTFDLNLLDSWDGDSLNEGRDRFFLKINNTTVFNEFLTNHAGGEGNFRDADIGPYNIGWGEWNDSVFKGIRIDFLVAEGVSNLEFKFRGTADQGMEDESWGLDNVHLTRRLVPAPASALVLGAFGALAGRRRR